MPIHYIIVLPSFLRRTMKAYALKANIRAQDCELHRIGRSRNWQLKANIKQLQAIITMIDNADEVSWLWLARLLEQQYQHLSHDALINFAKGLANVSVNTLMSQTDCTIAQARKVIDELEGIE